MRDLLVTAIVFGLLPFVFKRPWVGVMLWSWLAYMNPHRQTWGFAYDFPFSMVVALVTLTALLLSSQKKEMIWSRETAVWALFIGWMFLSNFFAFYPDLAWEGWTKTAKIQLMVLVVILIIRERRQIDWMIWVITMSIGYYGFKGGLFTIATGGHFYVVGPAGTFFGGNNEIALVLIMVIPLMRYLQLQTERRWVRLGLGAVMLLSGIAAIGSQSRGALLALAAMGVFLWFKSRNKLAIGMLVVAAGVSVLMLMPESWYQRMDTIQSYEQDASALGRINAWHTAVNVALSNVGGGGFHTFQPQTFRQYAPNPLDVHDAHSVYFELLGEQGFIGLGLWLLLAMFVWQRGNQIIRECREVPEKKWAADLAAMTQVSFIGYGTGGAFLGLAYFDLPYNLMAILLLTARIAGLFDSRPTQAWRRNTAGPDVAKPGG